MIVVREFLRFEKCFTNFITHMTYEFVLSSIPLHTILGTVKNDFFIDTLCKTNDNVLHSCVICKKWCVSFTCWLKKYITYQNELIWSCEKYQISAWKNRKGISEGLKINHVVIYGIDMNIFRETWLFLITYLTTTICKHDNKI